MLSLLLSPGPDIKFEQFPTSGWKTGRNASKSITHEIGIYSLKLSTLLNLKEKTQLLRF